LPAGCCANNPCSEGPARPCLECTAVRGSKGQTIHITKLCKLDPLDSCLLGSSAMKDGRVPGQATGRFGYRARHPALHRLQFSERYPGP